MSQPISKGQALLQRVALLRQLTQEPLVISFIGCMTYGCQTRGIEQLTDTAPRNVFFPGKFLASVTADQFPVHLLGANGVPSAIVTRDPSNKLHVIAFDGKKPCSLGPIAPVDDPIGDSTYAPIDDYLAYQVRIDENNTELHITNDHCREPVEPFTNAKVVGNPAVYQPESFVILAHDHRLLRLRPENGTTTVIATDVHDAVQTSKYLFTLEGGKVTVRDRKLEKIRTLGSSVTELRVDGPNHRVAFVGKRGLFFAPSANEPAVHVDDSACHVAWSDAPKELTALQYETSCTDPTIIVNLVFAGKRIKLPRGARKPVSLRNFGTKSSPDWVISYFAKSEDPVVGDPIVATPSGTTFTALRRFIGRIDETAIELGRARTSRSYSAVADGKAMLWIDPGTAESRLIAWSPSQQSVYLRQVQDFAYAKSSMRALVRDNDENALLMVNPGNKPLNLVKNAHGIGKNGSSGLLLFSDAKTDVGQVSFLKNDGDLPEELFSSAYVPSAYLIWNEVAASALDRFSTQTGRGALCIRLIESADTFCQPNVRSYLPTVRPAQGVAYVSTVGGKSALHWAEAR